MDDDVTSMNEIAEMLVYIGRVARLGDAGSDLTAAQWTALRFIARANHVSRTPSAFASFHATTRGTASQTIKSLVLRGYLVKTTADNDNRSVRLELTDNGRKAMRNDPLHALTEAVNRLEDRLRDALRYVGRSGNADTMEDHVKYLADLDS